MTLTVTDALPLSGHQWAWIDLHWGNRQETAHEVAERILPTLGLVRARFPAAEAQWLIRTGRTFGLMEELPVPEDPHELGALIASPRQKDAADGLSVQGTLEARYTLYEGHDPEAGRIFDFSAEAGAGYNGISLRLPGGFLLGTPEEAAEWFRRLVAIWEPGFAAVGSTVAQAAMMDRGVQLDTRFLEKLPVGYLNWFSLAAYGRPSPPSQHQHEYPDGTLVAVSKWSTAAAVELGVEMEGRGMLHWPPRDTPAPGPIP